MSRLPPESVYPSHDPSRVTSQGEERVPDLPEDWRRVASVRLREGMQASLCLSAEDRHIPISQDYAAPASILDDFDVLGG